MGIPSKGQLVIAKRDLPTALQLAFLDVCKQRLQIQSPQSGTAGSGIAAAAGTQQPPDFQQPPCRFGAGYKQNREQLPVSA